MLDLGFAPDGTAVLHDGVRARAGAPTCALRAGRLAGAVLRGGRGGARARGAARGGRAARRPEAVEPAGACPATPSGRPARGGPHPRLRARGAARPRARGPPRHAGLRRARGRARREPPRSPRTSTAWARRSTRSPRGQRGVRAGARSGSRAAAPAGGAAPRRWRSRRRACPRRSSQLVLRLMAPSAAASGRATRARCARSSSASIRRRAARSRSACSTEMRRGPRARAGAARALARARARRAARLLVTGESGSGQVGAARRARACAPRSRAARVIAPLVRRLRRAGRAGRGARGGSSPPRRAPSRRQRRLGARARAARRAGRASGRRGHDRAARTPPRPGAGDLRGRGRRRWCCSTTCEHLDAPSRRLRPRARSSTPAPRRCAGCGPGRAGAAGAAEGDLVLLDGRARRDRLELARARRRGHGAPGRRAAARHAAARARGVPLGRSGGHPGLTVELLRAAVDARRAARERRVGLVVDSRRARGAGAARGLRGARCCARLARLATPARAAAAIALAVRGRAAHRTRCARWRPRRDRRRWPSCARPGSRARTSAAALAHSPARARRPAVLAGLGAGERGGARTARRSPSRGCSAAERFAHLRAAWATPRGARSRRPRRWRRGAEAALAREAAALAECDARGGGRDVVRARRDAAHRRGRYGAAIPHLERALEDARPGRSARGCWRSCSPAFLRAGRPAEVERVVAQALAEDPPDADPRAPAAATRPRAGRRRAARCGRGARGRARRSRAPRPRGTTRRGLRVAHAGSASGVGLGRCAEAAAARPGSREAWRASATRRATRSAPSECGRSPPACQRRSGRRRATLTARRSPAARAQGAAAGHEEARDQPGRHCSSRPAAGPRRPRRSPRASRIALEDGRPDGRDGHANLALLDGLTRPRRPRAAPRARRPAAGARVAAASRAVRAARPGAGAPHRRTAPPRPARRAPRRLALATAVAARPRAATGARSSTCAVCERARAAGGEAEEVCGARARGRGAAALRRADRCSSPARGPGGAAAAATRRGGRAWSRAARRGSPGRTAPYARRTWRSSSAEPALRAGATRGGGVRLARQCAGRVRLAARAGRPRRGGARVRAAGAWRPTPAPSAPVARVAAGGRRPAYERLGDHPGRERALALPGGVAAAHAGAGRRRAAPDRGPAPLREPAARLALRPARCCPPRAMRMAVEHLDAERGVLLLADDAHAAARARRGARRGGRGDARPRARATAAASSSASPAAAAAC